MDHGDHGGHGGHDMPMGPMCSMNMLWNTQIIDTCIVFPSWHISSHTQFVLSCIAVAALGVLYEYLRAVQTAVDVRVARALAGSKGKTRARSGSRTPDGEPEEAGLLSGTIGNGYWGAGKMIDQNSSWTTTIPATVPSGDYLIRFETIALHSLPAQLYPECAQINISGGGSRQPTTDELVSFPGAYSATDPGRASSLCLVWCRYI